MNAATSTRTGLTRGTALRYAAEVIILSLGIATLSAGAMAVEQADLAQIGTPPVMEECVDPSSDGERWEAPPSPQGPAGPSTPY